MSYFVVATDVKGVVGAPFQICVLPHVRLIAEFQPRTATGKLKAVMMPIDPRGFHCSNKLWFGPELITKFVNTTKDCIKKLKHMLLFYLDTYQNDSKKTVFCNLGFWIINESILNKTAFKSMLIIDSYQSTK